VPGRKTDVKDCDWLADLLRHGLLRASFVPDRARGELRELVRYRIGLVEERAREVNRLQKTLEGANVKLAAVASDITGLSARRMLARLVGGETDVAALAELARGRMRAKIPVLERALAGRFGPHQRYLVATILAHVDFPEASIAELSGQIAERLQPEAAALARLDTIPGVGRWTAEILVAELGTDMARFPTAGHCASWAGLCPGNRESAGKRKSGKTRPGNRWLRAALTEAAQAAGRMRTNYLGAQYRRLAGRRGNKRAALAVAHSILVIAYHLFHNPDAVYQDLGPDYFDRLHPQHRERRLVRCLERLGFKVTLEPAA